MRVVLSLVIPAYNEEQRIASTVEQVVRDAAVCAPGPYEVLVVDDGSRDGTAEVVERVARRHPEIRLLRHAANQGKGAAVRTGMLSATGAVVCFTDADLSTPLEMLSRMLPLLADGRDVVIGSRAMAESELVVRQHPVRELMGKTFNRIIRVMFGMRFGDTQCGFKGFRREAAQAIFSRARVSGFAFDVEILLLAERLGLSITEIPVRWRHSRPSKVRVPVHPWRMYRELWVIRRHLRRGAYHLQPLQATLRPRQRLSAVILTKNEEARIARCLESVAGWADEIVVVDGMSTDRTVDICERYGARVIRHPFSGDFGQERNVGNDAARGDWILQLDADDTVSPQLRDQIQQLLRDGSSFSAYKFRRKNWFLGHEMRYGGWYHYYPHLFRRGQAHFEGRVHHLLKTQGPMGILEGALEHRPFESIEQFISRHNRYTALEAQEMRDREGLISPAVVRYHLTRRPLKLFWKMYVKKQGFREGWHGLVFSLLFAWVHVMKWAKYWELARANAGGVAPSAVPPPSAEGPLSRGAPGPPGASAGAGRCGTLSVVLMTKNEEHRLASCLDRVAGWADEIVVIDDLSTDRTVEIARRYTDKVWCAASEDNHDRQWNRGIERATGDWILHIDADEVVTPRLRAAIDRALTDPQGHSAFEMMRKNYFLGRPMRYGGWYHRHLVLFRRDRARCTGEGIHVQLKVDGSIGFLDAELEHYPFGSITQFIERQNHYTSVESRGLFQRPGRVPARTLLYQLTWRPVKLFWKSYRKHQGRREGEYGLIFGLLYAFAHLMFWAKYWESTHASA